MKKKESDQKPNLQAAKEYVEQQIAIMKQHGKAPKLTKDAYNAVVQEVLAATR